MGIKKKYYFSAIAVILISFLTNPVMAEKNLDDFNFSDIDEIIDSDIEGFETSVNSENILSGFIPFESTFSPHREQDCLKKLKPGLNISAQKKFSHKADGKITFVLNRDYAHNLTSDQYRGDYEAELSDTYLNFDISDAFKVKSGRQVVPWGASDYFQVCDLINPRDRREPGMIDPQYIRLPVFSTKFSFLFSGLSLDLIAVHESRPDKLPYEESDFDIYHSSRSGGLVINDKEKRYTPFNEIQGGFKLTKIFNGFDISLMGANLYDHSPVLVPELKNDSILKEEFKKISMTGLLLGINKGNFLTRLESSILFDKAVMKKIYKIFPEKTYSEKNFFKALAAMEYSGINDLNLSIEAFYREILDYDDNLAPEKRSLSFQFRTKYEFFNSDLIYNLKILSTPEQEENILNTGLNYRLNQNMRIESGIIFYKMDKKGSPNYHFDKNDRIYINLKYYL